MNNSLNRTSQTSTDNHVIYRYAVLDDAQEIAQLVNSAYRGESSRAGWTTEADLLSGTRISTEEVQEEIADEDTIILLCLQNQAMIGCVQLQRTEDAAYFGMFVVKPTLQGAGIGKAFMQEAENLVKKIWDTQKMWMTVISVRSELIAYYERRGYQRTGRFKPFDVGVFNGDLKVSDLQFEELEKVL